MLSNLQLEILKTLEYPLPDSQLLEIKRILAKYFLEKMDNELDELFEKNNWDVNEKVNEWLGEHLRTPYIHKSDTAT